MYNAVLYTTIEYIMLYLLSTTIYIDSVKIIKIPCDNTQGIDF